MSEALERGAPQEGPHDDRQQIRNEQHERLIFGACLGLIGLIADYARVSVVLDGIDSPLGAVGAGAAFVRRHFGSVVTLYVLTGLLFVALLIVYGYVDVYGGSRVGGWRGIAIAQAYIIARVVIRLTFGASEVRLYRLLTGQSAS